MKNKTLGKFGEDVVCKYFEDKEYEILDRNFHCRYGEIDLVLKKSNKLFFVEVKTRTNFSFGNIEDSISFFKLERLEKSIESYITSKNYRGEYILLFAFLFLDMKNKKAKIKIVEYL